MGGKAQSKVYLNDEARQLFESRRPGLLFTRFCVERTELPCGRDAEGYWVYERSPIRLAAFSFREDFDRRDDWCRFELHAPIQWTNPVFVVSEYFLGGNLVDKVVVTSSSGHVVELVDIDASTFFERTVRITQLWGSRRQRIIKFAKSNRKPVVLRRFLQSDQFDLDCCTKSIEGLLRNNVVEIARDYIRGNPREVVRPPASFNAIQRAKPQHQ
jgi:hypothetical protein